MAADVGVPHTRASGEAQDLSLVTPLMAKSAITDKNKLFPLPRWAPRSGFTMEYQRQTIGLRRLGKAFGLAADWIHDKPPLTPRLNELNAMPVRARNGEAAEAKRTLAAQEVHKLDAWRAVNTAIYFHVEPAIDVKGTFYMRDCEAMTVSA